MNFQSNPRILRRVSWGLIAKVVVLGGLYVWCQGSFALGDETAGQSPTTVAALWQEASKAEPQAAESPPAAEPGAQPAPKPEPSPPPAGPSQVPATPPTPPSPAPQEAKPTPAPPQIPAGELYEVKPELFKIEVTLSGKFHPEQAAEIILQPKNWTTFRVKKAVEHGSTVKKGDVLIEFERERYEEALVDQRRRVESATIALKRAEEELRFAQSVNPLDLQLARRNKQMIDEDWDYYQKVDRPFAEKFAKFIAEIAKWYLEYEQEELRQLEKMYQADELTDETEEIILRRQRNSVRMAEMDLELAEKRFGETMKFTIPRRTESQELSHKRAEHTLRYLEATLPLTVRDAELSFEQAKITLEREQKRLKELETDGELLEIRSPMEGIVYYGRIQRGSWSAPSTASERLVPGSSADTNKVLMTIVQPRPLSVWVDVPENRLARLRVGLSGTAQLPVLPGTYLPAKVAELSPVPVREGTFAARIEVQIPEEARGVVPGGSCEVRFVPYLKQRTLVVPSSAVGTDELDPAKKFVYRLDAAGRVVRQPVTVGEQSGNLVEILDGLVAGDRILRNYSAGERYLDK
jgi:HlyD family secretion protein